MVATAQRGSDGHGAVPLATDTTQRHSCSDERSLSCILGLDVPDVFWIESRLAFQILSSRGRRHARTRIALETDERGALAVAKNFAQYSNLGERIHLSGVRSKGRLCQARLDRTLSQRHCARPHAEINNRVLGGHRTGFWTFHAIADRRVGYVSRREFKFEIVSVNRVDE
jgi:hypothetical protein